ncbi:MAG: nucleotidyltransferase domain-containing protein [Planctomycetes bacterium]|nr:nucleotidyltransferase domain-containing protein [Planctomycetota bacterium]
MDPKVQQMLGELRAGLEALYGDRLRHLILFGSQARGDAEPGWGSDIDILAVLADPVDLDAEDERTGDLVAGLSLRHDMLVSLVLMEESRFVHRNGPLLRNIRREGVPV